MEIYNIFQERIKMSDDISMVTIGGIRVGLIGLTNIMEEVKALELTLDMEIQNALLEKVKSQNYVPPSREQDYGRALLNIYKKSLGLPVDEEEESTGLVIRILGPGCYACDKLMEDTKVILAELNIAADVEHVRDKKEIGRYGMVGTPALIINKKVVLSGRTLPRSQLKKLFESTLE